MSEIILPDSPEAATYRTDIKGWVSRKGFYWGEDERMARYDGSTHSRCGCGATVGKSRTICDACYGIKRTAVYNAMPVKKWEDGPACIFDDDRYFFSHDEFFEWCEDEENDPANIRLVLCAPEEMPTISEDFFENVLPEDWSLCDLPEAIREAVDLFNGTMLNAEPITWGAISVRVDMADLLSEQPPRGGKEE